MEGGVPSVEEAQMRQQQIAEAEERRKMILEQILEPQAKDRLSRLALVKKEKARAVEDSLIRAAQSGSLKGRVTEAQLIAMLEQISGGAGTADGGDEGGRPKKGITVQRRKTGFEDDDDDDDSDLL